MAAAWTTSPLPVVRILKNAAANTHPTAAVQTTQHLRAATITKAVLAISTKTDAVPTRSHRPKDRNSKDAAANTINSVAAPMALRLQKDRTAMAATVRNASTNVVPMASRQPLEPTSRDAHVRQVNTAAVPMASMTPKDRVSKDAKRFRLPRKRLAVSPRTVALAPISRSNISSIWNMAVAHVSGTAAAAATTIATTQSKSASRRARPQPERRLVSCRKSMARAPATIQSITTIQIEIRARNSFTVDAWATPTDSKHWPIAKNCVKSTNRCVSWEIVFDFDVFVC